MEIRNSKTLAGKLSPSGLARLHFIKLIIRSLIFIAAVAAYLIDKTLILDNIYHIGSPGVYLLLVIWVLFVMEMLFRFFPSGYESMGSQKQFARNFVPRDNILTLDGSVKRNHLKSVVIMAVLGIMLNSVIGVLFFTGTIDAAVLLIISLFFAVCDIICILFYCPFQSLIMKNRCCVTCRIYNWDFLMMFTPLVFVGSYYTLSLFAIALLVFIRWEVAYYKQTEWFYEETNIKLACKACTERLCIHKKSILMLVRETRDKKQDSHIVNSG
jgi:hypothetical protein